MAKQVQFRRGTTSQHSTFTGAVGEITVDTDKNTAVVHDGSTAGGHPLATSLADLGVTASAADLNTTDVTTLGTVEASKVVTADANGDVNFGSGNIVVDTTTFKIDSLNNRIGIGTASPTNPVHVKVSGAAATILAESDAGYDVQYRFEQGGAFVGAVGYDDSEAKVYFNRYGNATTGLSVDASGDTIAKGELIADSYNETYAAVTSSSNATTVDCEAGNAFSHTLTENTTFTFSNPPASGTAYSFSIEIIQDASASGFAVTWPSSVDWPAATAPTLTATASAKDVFVFTTRDGGTNWYGFTAGQALG